MSCNECGALIANGIQFYRTAANDGPASVQPSDPQPTGSPRAVPRSTRRKIFTWLICIILFVLLLFIAAAIPCLIRSRLSVNESSAINSLRRINTAQLEYASTYPKVGFACELSTLGGKTGAEPSADHAGLIDEPLTEGRKSGYYFELRCGPDPRHYFVVAYPVQPGQTGISSFCSDQSGVLKHSYEGSAEACLKEGKPYH